MKSTRTENESRALCEFGAILRRSGQDKPLYLVAEEAKLSTFGTYSLAKGRSEPGLITFLRLCRALKIDAGRLVKKLGAICFSEKAK